MSFFLSVCLCAFSLSSSGICVYSTVPRGRLPWEDGEVAEAGRKNEKRLGSVTLSHPQGDKTGFLLNREA